MQLNFRRQEYTFRGGDTQLAELRVFTADPRLVHWLKGHGMSDPVWAQVKQAAARETCASMFVGKRLGGLERQLAEVLGRLYQHATHRRAGRIDLMIVPDGGWECTPPRAGLTRR